MVGELQVELQLASYPVGAKHQVPWPEGANNKRLETRRRQLENVWTMNWGIKLAKTAQHRAMVICGQRSKTNGVKCFCRCSNALKKIIS